MYPMKDCWFGEHYDSEIEQYLRTLLTAVVLGLGEYCVSSNVLLKSLYPIFYGQIWRKFENCVV